jgi:hypothetical protein
MSSVVTAADERGKDQMIVPVKDKIAMALSHQSTRLQRKDGMGGASARSLARVLCAVVGLSLLCGVASAQTPAMDALGLARQATLRATEAKQRALIVLQETDAYKAYDAALKAEQAAISSEKAVIAALNVKAVDPPKEAK